MNTLRLMVFALVVFGGAGQTLAQNLVQNGDFEAGLDDWTIWAVAPTLFWDGVWQHTNDCDIWVPTNGCPFEGGISHAQKKGSGAGNAHGGLLQTLTVVPGQTYRVTGNWSGGVTGNLEGNNGTWWEIVVYDGIVTPAVIDGALRPQDRLIAKREVNNLGNGEVFQFQWSDFAGNFIAQSGVATLVLKTGSYYTFEAAAYHDQISVTEYVTIPALGSIGLILLVLAMPMLAFILRRRRQLSGRAKIG